MLTRSILRSLSRGAVGDALAVQSEPSESGEDAAALRGRIAAAAQVPEGN
jgi:hypothetical protein